MTDPKIDILTGCFPLEDLLRNSAIRMPEQIELSCEQAARILTDMEHVDRELSYRTLIQGLGEGRVALIARQTDWNTLRVLAEGSDDPASKRVVAFITQHTITTTEA
jgi:hypothetical protein